MGAGIRPVADQDEAMVAFLEEVAEPDGDGGADTDAAPMAMGSDVLVKQLADAQRVHDADEQGDAVDLFTGNGQVWVHTCQRTTLGANVVHHLPER